MSTKLKPGDYDCYANAAEDEPMFILLARDQDAARIVKMWAFFRMQQIDMGLKPESDRAQVSEAMHCATEMEIWNKQYRVQQQMAALEFDDTGAPTTGQHRRRTKNSTSGAGDVE